MDLYVLLNFGIYSLNIVSFVIFYWANELVSFNFLGSYFPYQFGDMGEKPEQKLIPICFLPADPQSLREDLHAVFYFGHLSGLLLPGQPDPSSGHTGI